MLKDLRFKKEFFLIAGSFLLLFISYQLALKKTIEAWQVNHNLNQQLAESLAINNQPAYHERKNNNLSKIIDQYRADTIEFRNKVIITISSIAETENTKLNMVPTDDPLFKDLDFHVQKFEFSGNYFSLIKLLNHLNKEKNIGIIRSITLKEAGPNQKTNINKQILEIFQVFINP